MSEPRTVDSVAWGGRWCYGDGLAHLVGSDADGNRNPDARALCGHRIVWGNPVEDDHEVCPKCVGFAEVYAA